MNFMEPEKSEEENSNTLPQLITLLPSGYKSPTLNYSFRHHFFQTQYERQIFRAQYSNSITKVSINNNNNYYIVLFESEMQIIKFDGDKMIPTPTQVFCSFILPLKQGKNPKIAQFLLIDRSNKFMILELDYIKDDPPKFPIRDDDEDIKKYNIFQKEIFQQVCLSKDYELLILVSKQKVYFLNLIDQSKNFMVNPIIDQKNNYLKPFIEFSQNKKYLVLAQRNEIYIIYNQGVLNQQILQNKYIINIKLCQQQLYIVTNKAFTKILNISNDSIKLQETDFNYFDEEISYAHFETENDKLSSILLIYQTGEIAYFDTNKIIKLDLSIDKNYTVKYIELEKLTQQLIRFRIFYFTQQKQLGSITFQGNI